MGSKKPRAEMHPKVEPVPAEVPDAPANPSQAGSRICSPEAGFRAVRAFRTFQSCARRRMNDIQVR
jgi:hypothetical protein